MKKEQKKYLKCRGTRHRAQKEKGITLIALVITIILLLILAGVTLKIVIDNNFVEKTQTAVDKYSRAQARENLEIALLNYKIGQLTGEEKTLQEYLEEAKITISNKEGENYTVQIKGYEFKINEKTLEIEEIASETNPIEKDKRTLTIKHYLENIDNENEYTYLGEKTDDKREIENNKKITLADFKKEINAAIGALKIGKLENGTEATETTITKDTIIKLYYRRNTYTITIETAEGINTVTGAGTCKVGAQKEIEVAVKSGYKFEKWEIVEGTAEIADVTNAKTTITPTSNVTIKAIVKSGKVESDETIKTTTTKLLDGNYSYSNPPIPAGFRTLNTEEAKWESTDGVTVAGWDNGLVITDSVSGIDGNEFVWVPVDKTNVTYDKWLGNTSNTIITSLSQLSEDSVPLNEQEQIKNYGGFYIGRYEAGIPESMTEAINTASADKRNKSGEGIIPVVKKNQVPWNYIDYNNAKANAERMYNTSSVKSGLLTGKSWDATMKWLKNANINVETDCRDWGNYRNVGVTGITQYSPHGNYGASWTNVSSRTKPTSGAKDADYMWLLKTGHTDYTKRKNIYDLAGNLWEWTNEWVDVSSTSYRVLRGGYYAGDGEFLTAMYRSFNGAADSGRRHRFSCQALYPVALNSEKNNRKRL